MHQTARCFASTLILLALSVMEVDRQVRAVVVPAQVDQDRVVANQVVANQAATNRTRESEDVVRFEDAILRMICFTCDVL